MQREIDARMYPDISVENRVKESIAAICGVVAEALAKKPVLTLPKGKK